MLLYLLAPVVLIVPVGIYLYFLFRRLFRTLLADRRSKGQKWAAVLLAIVVALPVLNLFGVWAMVVLHFVAFSLLVDLVRLIYRACRKRKQSARGMEEGTREAGADAETVKAGVRDGAAGKSGRWSRLCDTGAVAAILTLAVMIYAYANMHQVRVQEYTVATEKDIRQEGYTVAFLSDLHFDTAMNEEQMAEHCRDIEAWEPDVVILGGDIVDEASTLEQVQAAFARLGQIDSAYGVYYVYGNHDKGTYSRDCDFTVEELAETIESAGVHILEDDTVQLNEELYLTGRRDRSDAASAEVVRLSPQELVEEIPSGSYGILADHQPREMEENAAAGYDLMLSGHTHGGQMWPVGLITELFDKGTVNYGQETFGDMELIVSSGIAGWGYPLRTGKHSEYVIVHIQGK